MRDIQLRPISDIVNEVVAEAKREAESCYQAALERGAERVKKIESTRRALAMLDAAGYDLMISEWNKGSHYTLDLGFFTNTRRGNRELAEVVRRVRLALDCRLRQVGKDVGDAKKKTVEYRLKPDDFPGVTVRFRRKLPRGARCRIVRQRSTYTTLVCEN